MRKTVESTFVTLDGVFPITLGEGDRLFAGIKTPRMQLIDTTRFNSGIVARKYVPM
jgi:hypothetical protein